MTNELEIAIKLSRMKGVGAASFKSLIDSYLLPSVATNIWKETIESQKILSVISKSKNTCDACIEKVISELRKNIYVGYYYGQSEYPQNLADLNEPPPVLFASSNLRNVPLAAVVGSRSVNEKILKKVRTITEKLINDGYGIVSGGALGVDKAAHEVALEKNAYTIAVLGSGINQIYPKENKELFDNIRKNGTLLTELMSDALPIKSFFPTRNRIIAALADLIVAFPSSKKSGTYITIKWAKKLNRRLIIFE